jgi:hypothetical protein
VRGPGVNRDTWFADAVTHTKEQSRHPFQGVRVNARASSSHRSSAGFAAAPTGAPLRSHTRYCTPGSSDDLVDAPSPVG